MLKMLIFDMILFLIQAFAQVFMIVTDVQFFKDVKSTDTHAFKSNNPVVHDIWGVSYLLGLFVSSLIFYI